MSQIPSRTIVALAVLLALGGAVAALPVASAHGGGGAAHDLWHRYVGPGGTVHDVLFGHASVATYVLLP